MLVILTIAISVAWSESFRCQLCKLVGVSRLAFVAGFEGQRE